jgi:hypothetical protein
LADLISKRMIMRDFYWCSYPTASKSWRHPGNFGPLDPHRLRDGSMILDLSPKLYSSGYQFGGVLLNLPPEVPDRRRQPSKPNLTSSDLLVLPTRPPLDDDPQDRRTIVKSCTPLETHVHEAIRRFFRYLDRGTATLSDEAVAKLEPEQRNFGSIVFSIFGGGEVRYLTGAGEERTLPASTTVAFLASCPSIGTGGPRLLAAFGAGGRETLAWGFLLRTHPGCRSLVDKALQSDTDYLAMVSFAVPETIPEPFLDYDHQQLNPVVEVEIKI